MRSYKNEETWVSYFDFRKISVQESDLERLTIRNTVDRWDQPSSQMSRVELLTVEDCFAVTGLGLLVIPDFPVPAGWKDCTDTITVTKPDGQQYEVMAQFSMAHFNLVDPNVSIDKRWRVVVRLLNGKKEDLPAGSKILVSQEIKDALKPGANF